MTFELAGDDTVIELTAVGETARGSAPYVVPDA
jgi:hypothetical protein